MYCSFNLKILTNWTLDNHLFHLLHNNYVLRIQFKQFYVEIVKDLGQRLMNENLNSEIDRKNLIFCLFFYLLFGCPKAIFGSLSR